MFCKKVNKSSRKQMIQFLKEHFRYNTMNTWNHSTSYANNVKIYNLDLTSEEQEIAYTILGDEYFYDYTLRPILDLFDDKYIGKYILGFNGRSGGYLVIYQCETKKSDYVSYCTMCGQKAYKKVPEEGMDINTIDKSTYTINNECGKCHNNSRVNYTKPQEDVRVYPGRSIDMNEDFEDFTLDELKERTCLVQDFDHTCDLIVKAIKEYCKDNKKERKEVM